jgi:hypothetical protein
MRGPALKIIRRFTPPGGSVLEMACAEGQLTLQMAGFAGRVVSVEGASAFAEQLRQKAIPNIEVFKACSRTSTAGSDSTSPS